MDIRIYINSILEGVTRIQNAPEGFDVDEVLSLLQSTDSAVWEAVSVMEDDS